MDNTLEALEDELRKNPEYVDEYIKLLEAENEALRTELARLKPSWDNAPEWATERYIRIDYIKESGKDGICHGYNEQRPESK